MPKKLKPGSTILVVDDAPAMIQFVKSLVENMLGGVVVTSANGAKAKEAILERDSPFDLVITDLEMPMVNGDELIEWMRVMAPQTKVILWTSSIEPKLTFDPDVFLNKPAELDVLVGSIQALIPHCFQETPAELAVT